MFVDLVDSDDVLQAVRTRGPMIPMDIRKFLGKGDSITIGAALSTLSSKGFIKYTHVKMGGSPFYYVKGQESKLELLYKYLNDKDKKVFEILKQEKVLKDSSQEPLTRVSLRNIPDFAKKLELDVGGEARLYWRWYLLSEDEAINLVKGVQKPVVESSLEEEKVSQKDEGESLQKKSSVEETKVVEETPVEEKKSASSPQGSVASSNNSNNQEALQEKRVEKKSVEDNSSKKSVGQTTISGDVDFDDDFFQRLKSFFLDNGIKIKDAKLIRKNSDFEFIISLNTPFGVTDYFCKAKAKKKCNEGDLSSAYLQGQNKRLPTVFITSGEITKKAKQKVLDEYKGLLLKEL